MIKKYFSILEVSQLLSVPEYKIRYLYNSGKLSGINKLHDRSYFRIEDVQFIAQKFFQQTFPLEIINNRFLQLKITKLLKKFQDLL